MPERPVNSSWRHSYEDIQRPFGKFRYCVVFMFFKCFFKKITTELPRDLKSWSSSRAGDLWRIFGAQGLGHQRGMIGVQPNPTGLKGSSKARSLLFCQSRGGSSLQLVVLQVFASLEQDFLCDGTKVGHQSIGAMGFEWVQKGGHAFLFTFFDGFLMVLVVLHVILLLSSWHEHVFHVFSAGQYTNQHVSLQLPR